MRKSFTLGLIFNCYKISTHHFVTYRHHSKPGCFQNCRFLFLNLNTKNVAFTQTPLWKNLTAVIDFDASIVRSTKVWVFFLTSQIYNLIGDTSVLGRLFEDVSEKMGD